MGLRYIEMLPTAVLKKLISLFGGSTNYDRQTLQLQIDPKDPKGAG